MEKSKWEKEDFKDGDVIIGRAPNGNGGYQYCVTTIRHIRGIDGSIKEGLYTALPINMEFEIDEFIDKYKEIAILGNIKDIKFE